MTEQIRVRRYYADCETWGEKYQRAYGRYLSSSPEILMESLNRHFRARGACVTARYVDFQALLSVFEDLEFDLTEVLGDEGTVSLRTPFALHERTLFRISEDEI